MDSEVLVLVLSLLLPLLGDPLSVAQDEDEEKRFMNRSMSSQSSKSSRPARRREGLHDAGPVESSTDKQV